ncbi:MAG: hypothetical protein JWM56_642 [Candidatus Peribacteria bacterium]|nr:hypothetical protein [Candidatus Peribacteria bacterium]
MFSLFLRSIGSAAAIFLALPVFMPVHTVSTPVFVPEPALAKSYRPNIVQKEPPVTKAAQPITGNSVPGVGEPNRLRIPSIQLSTLTERISLLPDGKLDVPVNPLQLGWYSLGVKPGEQGNAVIDGHKDTAAGPAAFWNLKNVQAGDTIYVTDANGTERSFAVRATAVYDVDNAPMEQIFGKADGAHLNLITCAGVWSKKWNHYDKRLIIYSDLVTDMHVAVAEQ